VIDGGFTTKQGLSAKRPYKCPQDATHTRQVQVLAYVWGEEVGARRFCAQKPLFFQAFRLG
jgi:hypothetical protein